MSFFKASRLLVGELLLRLLTTVLLDLLERSSGLLVVLEMLLKETSKVLLVDTRLVRLLLLENPPTTALEIQCTEILLLHNIHNDRLKHLDTLRLLTRRLAMLENLVLNATPLRHNRRKVLHFLGRARTVLVRR